MMRRTEKVLAVVLIGLALYGMQPAYAAHAATVPYYAINGDIEEFTPTYFKRFLDNAEKSGAKEVHIDIQSRGGNADSALQMFTDLRASGLRSICTVYELAASGAAVILQGCSVRQVMPESVIVIHNPYVGIPMPTRLTVENAIEIYGGLTRLATRMAVLMAQRLGMPLDAYKEKLKDGNDWEMDPEEALAANVVDVILPAPPPATQTGKVRLAPEPINP